MTTRYKRKNADALSSLSEHLEEAFRLTYRLGHKTPPEIRPLLHDLRQQLNAATLTQFEITITLWPKGRTP